MKDLADDCFAHDKDRMKHAEAIALLQKQVSTIVGTETIELAEVTGRILAQDISAPRNIPAFDNSAVDGFAFAHSDYEACGGFFPITARIPAGEAIDIELPSATSARIFTGARMPSGADTVAMQEDCELHTQDGTNFAIIPRGLKSGANCRLAGEDVKSGEMVAETNTVLRPQDLAAIASTGTNKIEVHNQLKIALFSSGDELLRPGDEFTVGKVYDANHFMLRSMLGTLPAEISDLGILPDDPNAVEALLEKATEDHNVVLSTGGASRGEEDHFVDALTKLGNCHMWQLAVKPGRPMAFGQIGNTPCFTLPGNPVAAFVCFLLYVRPALICLAGGNWNEPQRFSIPAAFSIKSKPDRREFLRGNLETNENGSVMVQKFQRDGSGLISGLRAADGLIEIPEKTTEISAGDPVDFIPFSELGIN